MNQRTLSTCTDNGKAENAETPEGDDGDVGRSAVRSISWRASEATRKEDKECTRVLASLARALYYAELCNSAEYIKHV